MYSMLDEDNFVVMLNNTFICVTSNYDEAREFYALERLWADAEQIDISQIVIEE